MRTCLRDTPASCSTTSFSVVRPMWTSACSKRSSFPCCRPLTMVSWKLRALSPDVSEHELEHDGPEEDHEHRGEDARDEREEHLHGRLARQLLRALGAIDSQLGGLDAQHLAEAG